jgi:RNA polymerase sigma-70 factor (ECF subfamily)
VSYFQNPMTSRQDDFESTRPLLFSIAYRMLGSAMDAEDVVQEAYLRWQRTSETEVRSPRAFLTTIVTRLAINELRSARSQRETYVGAWLPEPLVTETVPDASESVELAESLSMAFLMLLERLSPTERAVFLLREVFHFDYEEVARIVEKSEVNCRQIMTRARKHMEAGRTRFDADQEQAQRLVEQFTRASTQGDLEGLVSALSEDITLWADGGGKVRGAALRPIHGPDAVSRFLLGVMRRFVPTGTRVRPTEINGQPGFIAYVAGHARAALVFDIRDGRIQTVYAIGNPDKLRSLPPESTAH